MRRWMKQVVFSLALCLVLCACRDNTAPPAGSVPEPEVSQPGVSLPEAEPLPYTNPLTGEGSAVDLAQNRPIAVMINNLKKALPQLGISQADIIYEVLAEGEITRMLAVFQSVEQVETIGSVRSARDYYVSLAAGLDAIFLHAGGSPGAYNAIYNWSVTALDCVNGPYEGTLFWRDAERKKSAGYEHSVLTSGEKITQLLPTYTKLRLEHEDGYTAPFSFTADGTPAGGLPAQTITVPFSTYKTGIFTYDQETGLYCVSQYGAPYEDGNDGAQVAVRNVLVLYASMKVIDREGRLSVGLVGGGTGQFACGGQIVDITWEKPSNTGPMTFYTADGQVLELGVGRSYINVVSTGTAITVA